MGKRNWSEEELLLLRKLKRQGATWQEIANALGRTREAVRCYYKRLKRAEEIKIKPAELPLLIEEFGEEITFGVISDTHFGSKYTVLEAIETIPLQLVEEGAQFLCFLGDVYDGVNVYPAQYLEQDDPSADGQLALAVKCFPRLDAPIYVIGGNHDFSFQRSFGLDNLKRFSEIRKELTFLGYFQADLKVTPEISIKLYHPRGGLTKTRSRCVQNAIENFIPNGPQILLLGHYHWGYLVIKYLGTWAVLAPSFQRTTPYFRRRGQRSEIGGVLVSFKIKGKKVASLSWKYLEFSP